MTPSPIRSMLLAATLTVATGGAALAADAAHPTVVELFQSQGCSSCPPANANLMAIASRPDVLALSFGVTYWDQLGWKDTFAQDTFTARQWDYARGLHHPNVFTPQVVVNGRRDGVGADRSELTGLIAAGDRGTSGPSLSVAGGKIVLGAGRVPAGGADVWLVRFDPRIVQVPVTRGENAGRTLPHRNVVRELVRLGRWNGEAKILAAPPVRDPALSTAVLVQQSGGGPILAATRA